MRFCPNQNIGVPAAVLLEEQFELRRGPIPDADELVRYRHAHPHAPDIILDAYKQDIERLVAERGFKTVDVVSISPDHPQRETMRGKFLDEHFHKEDEVRFFVAGSGLFTLHVGDKVYEIECVKDDLIAVPDGTTHWFDMGDEPSFVAIRFFTEPDGWVGHFTGTDIAQKFPRYVPTQAS